VTTLARDRHELPVLDDELAGDSVQVNACASCHALDRIARLAHGSHTRDVVAALGAGLYPEGSIGFCGGSSRKPQSRCDCFVPFAASTMQQRTRCKIAIKDVLKKVGRIDIQAPQGATLSIDGTALPPEPVPRSRPWRSRGESLGP
jgi:hypothetical protein